MKAKILDKKEFTPITIELTIETKEEFLNIHERMTVSSRFIDSDNKERLNDIETSFDEVLKSIEEVL